MAYVIFDLDGTVIDSSHRHLSNPDGSIDLAHWRENATPEKIARDGLLPLIRSMRAMHDAGHHVIICTARQFTPADLQFLGDNNVPYSGLITRPIGCTTDDATLKALQLTEYFAKLGLRLGVDVEPIMFDDNLKVVAKMIKIGVHCLDATKINRRMRGL